MNKIVCPKCGKSLINLSLSDKEFHFWCDKCNIDIIVDTNDDKSNIVDSGKLVDMDLEFISTNIIEFSVKSDVSITVLPHREIDAFEIIMRTTNGKKSISEIFRSVDIHDRTEKVVNHSLQKTLKEMYKSLYEN